jgi:hypothetical protein
MEADSQKVYQVWLRLIEDEELAEATLAQRHRTFAETKNLEPLDLEILDEFARLPGTRFNIENLRFRAADETADVILVYLPGTARLLTEGRRPWLVDIAWDYLARNSWRALGQMRIAECERFAEYVRTQIMNRRPVPQHFSVLLEFELAVLRLIRKTASIPEDAWPKKKVETTHGLRPRHSPAAEAISLPVDISEWIRSGDPLTGTVGPRPITMLVVIPSLQEPRKLHKLSEGSRLVFERCTGAQTIAELAEELEARHRVPRAQVFNLIDRLIDSAALVV